LGGRPAAPVPIYFFLSGGMSLLFTLIFTVNMIYQAAVVGLNPLQLVLVGTLLEAVCFVFEVPTGIVADSYSRRLSIVIGLFLVGIGFVIEGSFPSFVMVLLCQVFWGIGATFLSGAVNAWITDEVGEDAVGHVLLRGGQVALIATIAGTLGAVGLGLISVRVPIVTGGIGFILFAISIAVLMPETWKPTAREAATTHYAHMRTTFLQGLRLARNRPTVRMMILISLFFGLSSEAFDRLQTKFILDRFDFPEVFGTSDPVIWFGGASLVGTALSLIASEFWKRHKPESLSAGTPSRILATISALHVVATIGFALAGSLWIAFGMLWVRGVLGTLADPIRGAWMNRSLEPNARATVLSMESQANAFGQIAGGPGLGWVGNSVSIRAALLGSALLLTPVVALYRRFVDREDLTRASEPVEVRA
jgi:DHA3 family tetracycline resistance protein-like MFS transporter